MPENYRVHAAECLSQSQHTKNTGSKVLLLRLAQAWIELAETRRLPVNTNNSAASRSQHDALDVEGYVS